MGAATLNVPFGDLRRDQPEVRRDVQAAIQRVLASGWFILGPECAAFENEFAAYCDTRHAIAVASGTDAVMLSIVAADVVDGDEVITTTLTSVATAMAITLAGGVPVLVDIDPMTLNLNLDQVKTALTERTRAVVPVHLHGRPVDVGALNQFLAGRSIAVIEDACQGHGATIGGQRVGSLGLTGCFSFYPSKNLGAFGDGGMITTDDDNLDTRLRELRQYGWRERDRSERYGFNSRLDEIQAAVLRAKLPRLDGWNSRRRELAQVYREHLHGVPGLCLPPDDAGHVYHLFAVLVKERDRVREELAKLGIGTGIHYPLPVHRQPAFAGRRYDPLAFPHADSASARLLSLPMFPQLTDAEVVQVSGALRSALRG